MHIPRDFARMINRRRLFSQAAGGLGGLALSSLLAASSSTKAAEQPRPTVGLPELPHFAPRARRVIFARHTSHSASHEQAF